MKLSGIIEFIKFGTTFGLKNLFCFNFEKWTLYKLPIFLPIFGIISHKEELLNIRDNILQGLLRDRGMERHIRKAKKPVIVDCGVNVGVTVRWWFYLNPRATVYGIDMMQEANDFTIMALPDRFKTRFVPITAALASNKGHVVEISYDDPLFGGNDAGVTSRYFQKRQVHSTTLDDCLHDYRIDTIDLLKVDIEDSAAQMFQGAIQTLLKVKTILLEIHSEKERDNCCHLLREKGFCVRRSYKRHLWLEKTAEN